MITPEQAREHYEERKKYAHEMHIKQICDSLDERLIEAYNIISNGGQHPIRISYALVTHSDAEEILPKYKELGWNIEFKNGNFIINPD